MPYSIIFQPMANGEEKLVSDLVRDIFIEFVASDFSIEGVKTFMEYISADSIVKRISDGSHFIITARENEKIVGAIEIRDYNHICMLFVDRDYHKRGIAKKLYNTALDMCRKSASNLTEFKVNSSRYAVPVYQKLGFKKLEEEQIKDGFVFTPMKASMDIQ